MNPDDSSLEPNKKNHVCGSATYAWVESCVYKKRHLRLVVWRPSWIASLATVDHRTNHLCREGHDVVSHLLSGRWGVRSIGTVHPWITGMTCPSRVSTNT